MLKASEAREIAEKSRIAMLEEMRETLTFKSIVEHVDSKIRQAAQAHENYVFLPFAKLNDAGKLEQPAGPESLWANAEWFDILRDELEEHGYKTKYDFDNSGKAWGIAVEW